MHIEQSKKQNDDKLIGADSSVDEISEKNTEEIKNKRKFHNKIPCQRCRDTKKAVTIINPQ